MRTTIEMPDQLLSQAKIHAATHGISLRQFFIEAVEKQLSSVPVRTRLAPPSVGGPDAPRLGILTPEQVDEALFG